jgi:GR25 family glycosyltransferase involved in LPS biosynthesis
MESQLRACGLSDRYSRFAAIDGEDGQRACFQSHTAVLENADPGCPVHVLEDDVLLSGYVPEVADFIASAGVLDQFDIVFTETLVSPDVMQLRELKQLFDKHRANETFVLQDITPTYQCGASSYFVGKSRQAKACLCVSLRHKCSIRARHDDKGTAQRCGVVFEEGH